jgi:hypothetical protein
VFKRQSQLKVFLSNPDVPIDSNHLERALRVIPMGRKNHLFCWSELGAEQLGILQSLMVTSRIQSITPYTYLIDVLQRVGIHPAKDVLNLVPRVWKIKVADNPLKSDLSIPPQAKRLGILVSVQLLRNTHHNERLRHQSVNNKNVKGFKKIV